jgi:hypothetical protein
MTHLLQSPLSAGELFINLRAEAAPELLREEVAAALAGLDVPAQVQSLDAFRPGRPEPTHRMA